MSNLKQIKIFTDSSYNFLMDEVNEFLKENSEKIVDIKFSSSGNGDAYSTLYSVMIIIEEE